MPPSTIQRHRTILILIGLVLIIFFTLLYYSPYGYHNYLVIREDLNQLNTELTELKAKNQELEEEISLLKNDSNYVEKIARQKLGMLKKNELVFEVPEKKSKKE